MPSNTGSSNPDSSNPDSSNADSPAASKSTNFASRSLAELVTELPMRARVFETYRLDYCCHGNSSLEEACRQRDLPVSELVDALAAAEETGSGRDDEAGDRSHLDRDWSRSTVGELIDHIVEVHHDYLRRELPRLDELSRKVAHHRGRRDTRLLEVRRVFTLMHAELEAHMTKEERILFPLGRSLELARTPPGNGMTVRHPVGMMLEEHDDAGNSLVRLRCLTDGYQPPAGACVSYRTLLSSLETLEADLHIHIHEENNVLFPRLLQLEAEAAAKDHRNRP